MEILGQRENSMIRKEKKTSLSSGDSDLGIKNQEFTIIIRILME